MVNASLALCMLLLKAFSASQMLPAFKSARAMRHSILLRKDGPLSRLPYAAPLEFASVHDSARLQSADAPL